MSKTSSVVNEDDALALLDAADKEGGVNSIPEPPAPKVKSLGKSLSSIAAEESSISMANDVRWKVIPFKTLPSLGKFYPPDSEISIRSAEVMEIRHWSTIDENDSISINDCLNFILERCLKFKIKGRPVSLSWRDLLMVDRFFLIFKVHEITFPNGENKLMKTFECSSCKKEDRYSGKHQVKGHMLQGFTIPEELQQFYHEEYKTFFVQSEKFDNFYLNMPSIGAFNLVKQYISSRAERGKTSEKWFVRVAPYLIEDYESTTVDSLEKLREQTMNWHPNKMVFVTRAVDMLENSKNNRLSIKCPKCNSQIEADIFSSNSFTVKDLFLVSARLADLV